MHTLSVYIDQSFQKNRNTLVFIITHGETNLRNFVEITFALWTGGAVLRLHSKYEIETFFMLYVKFFVIDVKILYIWTTSMQQHATCEGSLD